MPQRFHPLESVSWGSQANRQVKLDLLPSQQRLYNLHLYFDLSGTKDAADAITADLFPRCVALLKVGQYVNIDGWALRELTRQIKGRTSNQGTDVPGSGTTFTMKFELVIPFRNPRQPGASDGAIPSELLHGKAIEITFAADNVWGVGNAKLTAGNVRCAAEMVHETNVPQLAEIGYKDPGAQTVQLEPGVYLDLFIVDGTTPGTITQAEVSAVSLEVDGESVWNNTLHEQIVAAYNDSGVLDSANEIAVNAATRLPLIWQDLHGKAEISKQPAIENGGRLQITGAMSSPRVVFWRALPKDQKAVEAIAAATGAPKNATEYEPTTASKKPLRAADKAVGGNLPKKARILGSVLAGKVREAGTANK